MTHNKANDFIALWQDKNSKNDDSFREVFRSMLQELLETEIESHIGASRYERTDSRRGHRNGYQQRMLNTRVGKIELMIPRDRDGNFRTELFDRYQRSEKALVLAILEMYISGVSTRKVRKITEELCGLDISKSQVSRLTKLLDKDVSTWRSRLLERPYRYLIVDALYEKIRNNGIPLSRAVLIVVGVTADGYREILGTWIGNTETEETWASVFRDLKSRGLRGVKFIVSDNHKGLRRAVGRHFQDVLWQRCHVHFMRNVLQHVKKMDIRRVADLLRAVTNSLTLEKARQRLDEAVEELRRDYPKVSAMLEDDAEEILSVFHLPEHHRRKLRSTNMLERYNSEIRRRTRVVRIFPNEASCVRLISAMAMEQNEEWMARKYIRMEQQVEENSNEKPCEAVA
jgi:transposase-like protein